MAPAGDPGEEPPGDAGPGAPAAAGGSEGRGEEAWGSGAPRAGRPLEAGGYGTPAVAGGSEGRGEEAGRARRGLVGRWARLAVVFFLIGLGTSRISLVLHELVGHGGLATLLGADVIAVRLFVLGGGWVRYRWTGDQGSLESIAVSLAGIALELAAAAGALFAARRLRGRGGVIVEVALVGFATANLVHAGFYLGTGTHHGFGDGRALHEVLGSGRAAVVWPAALFVIGAGFLLARRLARTTGGWVGARSRAGRTAALISAMVAAALAHGALTRAEQALAGDETYRRIMQRDGERRVARDLAARADRAARQGSPLDPQALAALRAELERRQRDFPLVPVLAGALALACAAGVWRGVGRPRDDGSGDVRDRPRDDGLRWRAVLPLALATGAALALVVALRLVE